MPDRVNFKNLDFSATATVKKLALEKDEIYAGKTSAQFVEASPFTF